MEDALAVSNLRCYQCSLKGLAANTVRAAFHPLRGLSEFLIHEAKLLEENPGKAFTMPKKAEGRRLTMSDPEALALLDAAARQCDPRKVAMSVALISALLYTGVRADELVNIRLADVLFDQEEMLVSKGKGGTDLGLAICREIVSSWADTISVESAVGQGTTVHVALPRAL